MKLKNKSFTRLTSAVIAILLVVMVVVMCCPYFTYGKEASVFKPEAGYAPFLGGKWIVSGTEPGQDGYKEIEIDSAVKTMTVNTTNAIRVNQLNADAAVEAAVAAYGDIKAAYEGADVINQQLAAREKLVEDIYAYITSVNAENAVNDGLIFAYFASEIDEAAVEAYKDAPLVLNAESIASIQANAKKSYDKLIKSIREAAEASATIEGNIAEIQEAVNTAVEGAKKAYEADAAYAWVTEDKAIFDAAFDAANPQVREKIVADNAAAFEDLEAKKAEYNTALEKTNAAKAAYDAAYAEANKKIEAQKKAYDDAVAAGETALAELKDEYDANVKASKATVAEKMEAYVAAINAANAKLAEIKAEYEAAEGADLKEYNEKFAEVTEAEAAVIAAAKAAYDEAAAANTAKLAELKAAYDKKVADQKAATEAIVNEAKKVYDEAAAGIVKDYESEKAEYTKLKKISDAAKKASSAKISLYTQEEVDELVYGIAGTNEELDNAVYSKLAAEKAKAAEGYAICDSVVKTSKDIVKAAEKAKKASDKALKDFDKEIEKLVGYAQDLKAADEYDVKAPAVEGKAAPELVVPEYEKTNDEPALMTTTGKVKYNDKKDLLTLTFANGEEIETTFTTNVSYNGTKELSILGYVGFPYNVPDFDMEMGYKIENYYINDVVLVPIALLILAVLGVIFCIIKKEKMSAAFLPVAFALVGILGYIFSDFLKLGDKYWVHMIGFILILVIAAAHIFFKSKEKKA
ncbi:MAG: hypothetical protein IKJ65_00950 [Clostridia bacterium]|nr:hypothetical protein [Clostridia bacterium]